MSQVHAPNEKDAMTSRCLDRKEVRHAIWRVHSTGPAWPVETRADRISYCPLDRKY